METNIAISLSFEERLANEIKSKIGELMTDEDLKKLIDKFVQKAFFEERVYPSNGYGGSERKPPYFINLTQDILSKKVESELKIWFEKQENQETIKNMISKVINDGIMQVIADFIKNSTQNVFYRFGSELESTIRGSLMSR